MTHMMYGAHDDLRQPCVNIVARLQSYDRVTNSGRARPARACTFFLVRFSPFL